MREVGGRDLVQVGFWRDSGAAVREALAADLGFAMPESLGSSTSHAELTAFMVAPDKFWITAPLAAGLHGRLSKRFATAVAVVTELGHSRTVIRLSGPSVREVLAQLVAVDLDPKVFPLGSVAMTPIHHVAVLVHSERRWGLRRLGCWPRRRRPAGGEPGRPSSTEPSATAGCRWSCGHLPRTIALLEATRAAAVLERHVLEEPSGAVRYRILRGMEPARRLRGCRVR